MRAVKSVLRGLKSISWLTSRQVSRLGGALLTSRVEKNGIIFDEKSSPEFVIVLVSGVARITCANRSGARTLVAMVRPGIVPRVPPASSGIDYGFRCAAATACVIGAVSSESFIDITLGIASADFERMANNYFGRWDLTHLRYSNFTGCTLEERVALMLLELSENFGIPDRRGVRLTMPASHRDFAQLVGASRPRVTEFILGFERRQLIVREGRQLIVRRDRLESFLRGSATPFKDTRTGQRGYRE